MANLLRDARFGFRLFRKNPGVHGRGRSDPRAGHRAPTRPSSASSTRRYLDPLPYRDADAARDGLVDATDGNRNMAARRPTILEWKRQATVFEDLNAWTGPRVNLAAGDAARAGRWPAPRRPASWPCWGYGRPLALGRDFLEEEGTAGKDEVVILSHRLWQQQPRRRPAASSGARSVSTAGRTPWWGCWAPAPPTAT